MTPASVTGLSQDQIDDILTWCEQYLEDLECEDERTAKWFVRRKAIWNMQRIFNAELDRREDQKRKLEAFGSLSIESQDPDQLTLWQQ